MLAKSVPILPEPVGRQDLRLEPKFDGFRVIAFCRPDDVILQSRAGRILTQYFPDIASALHTALPGQPVVDGEIVVWNPVRNRTDFALLQQRITAGRRLPQLVRDLPANFVIFDVLQDADGADLMSRPLRERRERLVALLADVPPALTLCPQTTSTAEALEWMQALTHAGIEGVVAKDAAGLYTPGRRVWLKYKSVGVGGGADEAVSGVCAGGRRRCG
jgi:ATP-dependent DNA ligase